MDAIKVIEGKTLTGKARSAFDAFVVAKQQEAEAKKAKAEAEKVLMDFLGEARVAYVGKVAVLKVVAGKNTSFDRETMKDIYPEAYETCLRETTYDYLRVV
jgi:poly-gamma-glutamate capsule biosynthesis protein CapA/YwtB (metallophosphatase superfamily)